MVNAVYPPGYVTYTNRQITDIIGQGATYYHVPTGLAYAMAWVESTFNPNASGDDDHSVGLFQLHDHGLGSGLDLITRVDPYANTDVALKHLSETTNPGSLGAWAAASQRPADPTGYAAKIEAALIARPWENLTDNDPANPPPPDGSVIPSFPGIPSFTPPWASPADPSPGPAEGSGTATGSGLPDLITADPITLGHIPGLGDVTLNMSPVLNWALRLGLTVGAGVLIVYGLIVLAKPVEAAVARTAARTAASVG